MNIQDVPDCVAQERAEPRLYPSLAAYTMK